MLLPCPRSDCTYLYRTLVNTPVWEAVLDVVGRGGVLAGCSAGAMVQGEMFMSPRGHRDGFGLVQRAAVVPHFDELPRAVARLIRRFTPRKLVMVEVDGNTALVQNGHALHVLGNGRVILWDHCGPTAYRAGDAIAQDALSSPSQEQTHDG